MQKYDQHIQALESLDSRLGKGLSTDELAALEEACDALAFCQGIHDMFVAQGVSLPPDPDLYKLEGVVEGYVGELVAAVMLLSNLQLGDTPGALERLNTALGDKMPPSVSTGFLRLADRVRKTRVAQQKVVQAT